MNRPLTGRSILVVEDEPLIALDIMEAFATAGARAQVARTLEEALRLVGQPEISAAVVDFGLGDDDSSSLCRRLRNRGIPFIHYSGYDLLRQVHDTDTVVAKPAHTDLLVSTVVGLLRTAGHLRMRRGLRLQDSRSLSPRSTNQY